MNDAPKGHIAPPLGPLPAPVEHTAALLVQPVQVYANSCQMDMKQVHPYVVWLDIIAALLSVLHVIVTLRLVILRVNQVCIV